MHVSSIVFISYILHRRNAKDLLLLHVYLFDSNAGEHKGLAYHQSHIYQ